MKDRRKEFVDVQRDLNARVFSGSTQIMMKYIDRAKSGELSDKEKELQEDIGHLIGTLTGLVSQVGYLYNFIFPPTEEKHTDIN